MMNWVDNGFIYRMVPGYRTSSGIILLFCVILFLHCSGAEKPAADRLHVHLISGSEEYRSGESLMKFRDILQETDHRITVTVSPGEDEGEHLPDIGQLAKADLMVVFARRMNLPDEQMQIITQHFENEKPVIGIRTASHAFDNYPAMDSEIFGGSYQGHADDETVAVEQNERLASHSLLEGVGEWTRPGKLYLNPELASGAELLLTGEGQESGISEPLAWTHRYGENGRAFYTSMGLPSDFEDDNFIRLLLNAVSWTSGYTFSGDRAGADSPPDGNEDKSPGSYKTMEYGAVLAESIRPEWPRESLVRKGLAIRMDHNTAMIFDTDLVRAAAWTTGGWLDISETDYTGYKGSDIAYTEGRQLFGTSEIAGWANEGNFYGPREGGMGPLPADWARYRGYYRYGDRIVLSYTVGNTDILELPEAHEIDGNILFTRTLRTASPHRPLELLVAEKKENWSRTGTPDGRFLLLETPSRDTTFAAGVVHGTGEERLRLRDGRVELHIPPSASPQTVQVYLAEWVSADPPDADDINNFLSDSGLPDLTDLTSGGPAAWEEGITLSGTLSDNEHGYVTDRLPVPFENPWGSWMRLSGLDFFNDGRAVVSTWNGDVWIVSGIDASLEQVTWRRFASGLFYPMGVAVVGGEIYVTERSQLTRLHDLNGNGEADYYENVNNDGIVYPMAHTLGLEVDSEGNFYFFKNGNRVPPEVPQHGGLIRVSADGAERELFARGYRGGNSLGIGPDDMILGADQEGNWVPVDRIDIMKQGGFYGDRRHGGEDLAPGDFEPPVAWTPHHINNSSGFLVYAGDTRWGPLSGQWVLGSYGQSKIFTVLMEEVGGRYQGGIAELPAESVSGLLRARFHPGDGQLYTVGLRGWQTLGTRDAGFERIRYAGGSVNHPEHLRVTSEGVGLRFTDPVNREMAADTANYRIERWDYIYSSRYGSPEVLPGSPDVEGRDTLKVTSVTVGENGREIFLEIPDMRPVMQMKVGYTLLFEDGNNHSGAIYHTVNWLTAGDANERPLWQQEIIKRGTDTEEAPPEEEVLAFEGETAPEWYQQGGESFRRNCASCHVSGGMAPSLETSEWAGGPPESLIKILLHGKRGNRGVMTPFAWMDDEEIAAILSYIRVQWHDKQEPVRTRAVNQIREQYGGRTELWTDEELKSEQ